MRQFTRIPTRTITTVFVIALVAVAAYAAVNFKSGPSFAIAATSLNLVGSGELSGLGSSAHVLMDAVGVANGTCTNKGGNLVPVQNASVTASGSTTIHPDNQGRSTFTVSAGPTANPNPCPNGNWTFDITQITYNSATLTITAGGSQVLGPTTYTFSPACTSSGEAETCSF